MLYNVDNDKLDCTIIKTDKIYINCLPNDMDIDHRFSKKFNCAMNRLIQESRNNEIIKKPARRLRQRIILIACIIILFTMNVCVCAVCRTIFDFIAYIF